ncbi:AaceriAGL206Cp [[Ashbya] aceris (nom. inval.)]|nr:AaceriAGL206Cp [[Ashbya] aceris (nom. inval.)]
MVVVRYRMRRSRDDALSAEDPALMAWSNGGGVNDDSRVLKKTEKRSRNGCLTCRARRKKCDETRPKCIGCQRNLLLCHWADDDGNYDGHSPNKEEVGIKSNDGFLNCTLENWEAEYEVGNSYRFFSVPAEQLKFEYTVALGRDNSIWRLHRSNGSKQRLQKFPTHGQLDKSGVAPRSAPVKLHKYPVGTKISARRSISAALILQDSKNDLLSSGAGYAVQRDDLLDLKSLFDLQMEPYQQIGEPQLWGCFLYSGTPLETIQPNYSYLLYDNNSNSVYYKEVLESFKHGDLSHANSIKNDDGFLFYVCYKEFIPLLDPQDSTYRLVTHTSSVIQQAENNPVMKELILSCGASFLQYYSYDTFAPLSDRYYNTALIFLSNFLGTHAVSGNEVWLLAVFQLMALKNKWCVQNNVNDVLECLTNSYLLLKNCYFGQYGDSISELFLSHPPLAACNSGLVGTLGVQRALERPAMPNTGEGGETSQLRENNLILLPQERTFLEVFIQCYSVCIMFATEQTPIPDPFHIFKELNPLFKCPVRHNTEDWVSGASYGYTLEAFEILAKVSYISRYSMPITDPAILQKCQDLQKMSRYYSNNLFSAEEPQAYDTYQFYALSFLSGLIVARSSYLLITTVLEYSVIQPHSPKLQETLGEIMNYFEAIPLDANIWGALTWPLLVCGVYCCTPDDQAHIRFYLGFLGKRFALPKTASIINYLESVWQLPLEQRIPQLFNRAELCKISI